LDVLTPAIENSTPLAHKVVLIVDLDDFENYFRILFLR
jgi:hypothetical protein